MKITQVIDQLGVGGAERVCLNLCNLFAQKGHKVKLIVFDEIGPLFQLLDKHVEVVILNKKRNKFKAYRKFTQEVQDADIVHIHMRQVYRFAQKAFLLFGKKRKIIFHDHYGKIAVKKHAPMFYRTLFRPAIYIGCSKLLTDWAIQKLKIKPQNVFMIGNFVTQYSAEKPKNNLQGWVMVGNLKSVKNHELAIRLAAEMQKELTIYCSETQGEYYEKLCKLIQSLNYQDKIHFKTGCYNVQAELNQYELALLPSISEGDALVVVEYMAQGIPFLVANVGESVKIIQQHFPFLVQKDYEIKNWKENYPKAIQLRSEEIKALYQNYFSEDLFLEKYMDVYQKLLKKNKA